MTVHCTQASASAGGTAACTCFPGSAAHWWASLSEGHKTHNPINSVLNWFSGYKSSYTHFLAPSSPPSCPRTTSSASSYLPSRSKIMKYSCTWKNQNPSHNINQRQKIRARVQAEQEKHSYFCLGFNLLLFDHLFYHALSERQEHCVGKLLVMGWNGLECKVIQEIPHAAYTSVKSSALNLWN